MTEHSLLFRRSATRHFHIRASRSSCKRSFATACSRVLVISGREVTDLLPLLNIHPRPEIWGVHGLQRLRTDGTTEMPHLDQQTLHGLSDAERWLSYKHLRHRAEFKPGGIAVHWRGLDALDAADLRARVLLGWRPIVAEYGLDLRTGVRWRN